MCIIVKSVIKFAIYMCITSLFNFSPTFKTNRSNVFGQKQIIGQFD